MINSLFPTHKTLYGPKYDLWNYANTEPPGGDNPRGLLFFSSICSWIQTLHNARILRNICFLAFEKWVQMIQNVGYNGALVVSKYLTNVCYSFTLIYSGSFQYTIDGLLNNLVLTLADMILLLTSKRIKIFEWIYFNPISTNQGRNQPLYERHVTKSGRNRAKPGVGLKSNKHA